MALASRLFRFFAGTVGLVFLGAFSARAQVQFEQWRTAIFSPTELADDGVGGLLADPDSDGLKNVQEYAFTGSAKFSDPLMLPSVSINLNHLTVSFVRPKYTPDLTYVAEVSSDLMTWYSGSSYTQQIAVFDRGDVEAVVIQDNLSLLSEARRFMRIRINYQPVDTGLILWLDAGADVTKDGSDKVTAWGDRSGALNHASASSTTTAPTWIADGINGRPVLRFDGVDDLLAAPSQLTSNNFTLFAVLKATNTHEVDTEGTTGTGGSSGQKYLFGAQSWEPDSGAGLSVGTNGLAAYERASSYMPPLATYSGTVGTSTSLVALRYLNKQPSLYLKGELVRVGLASPKAAVWAPSQIGSGDFGAFQGDVAEVMLYNRTLSTEEIARVDTYLSKKYGLQINPVVTISDPVGEISFGTERVDVQGTITHSLPLSSFEINGVHAFVDGTNFIARNVPLQPGLNVLTAIAKDISGHVGAVSANLTVASAVTPVNPVILEADVTSGFGPLIVAFTTTVNVPGDILEVLYDFDGDGVVDYTALTLGVVSHTYSTEGGYFPVVTIVTSVGTYSSVGGFYSSEDALITVQPAPAVTATMTSIAKPVDLKAVADGSLYVLSHTAATVTQFDATGAAVRTSASLGGAPTGLDVDADGRVYVALNTLNQVVRLIPNGATFAVDTAFNTTGKIGKADATSGSADGEFNHPFDVAVGGSRLYVTDTNNHRIQVFLLNGTFEKTFGVYGSDLDQFSSPKGIAYDKVDRFYVSDTGNNRVIAIAGSDALISVPGGIVGAASGDVVNLDADIGGVYVADAASSSVTALLPGSDAQSPSILWTLGAAYGFSHPQSVAAGIASSAQSLFIADTDNDRVVRVTIAPQTPLAVWSGFKSKISSGNVEGALADCNGAFAQSVRDVIGAIGVSGFSAWLADIGTLTPIEVTSTDAHYIFGHNISGVTISFSISFVQENGRWKIAQF